MKLHDDELVLGDRVYDVSVNRGFGTVISIEDGKYFQVKFDQYSVNYTPSGIQQGKSEPTLYWNKPLVIQPRKNELGWRRKSELVHKFLDLVKDYAEFA